MGQAVIGGVLASTLLTLLAVPVLYTYLDALVVRVQAWRARAEERSAAGAEGKML